MSLKNSPKAGQRGSQAGRCGGGSEARGYLDGVVEEGVDDVVSQQVGLQAQLQQLGVLGIVPTQHQDSHIEIWPKPLYYLIGIHAY